MQDQRWDRVRELFERVSELPPQERPEALRNLCPDADLQDEVLSLLEHDERAEPQFLTPLEHPLTETGGDGRDPLVGTRLGKCVIRRVIAAGGMGVVYEAEQENPRRIVAVKVLKSLPRSRIVRRRFEFEVEALGRLTHPNIARMYDADTISGDSVTAGTPYFVMEYVAEARTIVEKAAVANLDIEDRLQLLLQACDAVQYGHTRGIIHRDLKPANILVDASGQVKVIDFGVARATDADLAATTQLTDTGQLLGTIQYMSPEQCAGDPRDLDTRTDVYSLGVVLYQLLCGRLPYSSPTGTLTQAIRAICDSPPVPPRSVNREVRGNLEFILLAALQKDRDKRYQSVSDLARDIRHYLNREPIEARGQSSWTRIARWVGRHPVLLTGAASILVALIVALTAWFALWYASIRPYQVALVNDGQEARLLSMDNRIMHEWKGPVGSRKMGSGVLHNHPAYPGKTVAVVPFMRRIEAPTGLCVFDVGGSGSPELLWSDRILNRDLPAVLKYDGKPEDVAQDFGAGCIWILDIYEDEPGEEIVALFTHEFNCRALRIYTVDGRILYQTWYRGDIHSVYWLRKAKLLVVTGTSGDGTWERRGFSEIKNQLPLIAFAFKPTKGLRSTELIKTTAGTGIDEPLWYWCLWPPKSSDVFLEGRLRPPTPSHDDGFHVSYNLEYRSHQAVHADWLIDAAGKIDREGGVPSDTYRRLKELPRLEEFEFGPLPDLVAPVLGSQKQEGSPEITDP